MQSAVVAASLGKFFFKFFNQNNLGLDPDPESVFLDFYLLLILMLQI
jgi:hypothetical protein